MGLPSAYRTALSSRLASTCSSRTGSASTGGMVSGTRTSTRWPRDDSLAEERTRRTTEPAISASEVSSTRGSSAFASMRDMSSRLWTRRVSRSASSSMVTRNSCRSRSFQVTSGSSRLDADALIEASGVRRSCETELSRAVRSRSISSRARVLARSSSCRPCSTARAAWLAKVASRRRSASPKMGEPGPPATTTRAPTGSAPARNGTVSACPGWSLPPTPVPEVGARIRSSPEGVSPSRAAIRTPSRPSGRTMAQPARLNRDLTVRTTLVRVSSRLPCATRLVDSS